MVDKKTIAQQLGENLKRIRTEKGVSRKDLAAAIGITEFSFGKYERGEILPPLDKIFVLSDFLKVSILDLTGNNGYTPLEISADKQIFEYRLQRALKMATKAFTPLIPTEVDENGYITVFSPSRLIYENGIRKAGASNAVKFQNAEDFVQVMERAESRALFENIPFNQAFRNIVFK